MRTLPLVASLVTAAALALPAGAQSAPSKPGAGAPSAQARGGQSERRGQHVAEALRQAGVDDARIQRIEAIHKKYASQRRQLRSDAEQHRNALQALLRANSQDESAYQRSLDGLAQARQKQQQLREAERGEVRKILKPSEQAKLLAMRQRGPRKGPHASHPGSNRDDAAPARRAPQGDAERRARPRRPQAANGPHGGARL